MTAAGTIKSLWRYPVKSMGGEWLQESALTEGGLLGDRAFALIDRSNGRVASAKLPKKWGSLLDFAAAFVAEPRIDVQTPAVRIASPAGESILSSDAKADERLSKTLGRSVHLTSSRPKRISVERLDPLAADETIVDIGHLMLQGRFADYAPVHLITTATLARLAELCPEVQFDERRFRPNLVVGTGPDQEGFIENDWVGRTLSIGGEVRLRVSDPTPRCSVPTLPQPELSRDTRVLRTIVDHNRIAVDLLGGEMLPCAGVYAFVLKGGVVRHGDAVKVG